MVADPPGRGVPAPPASVRSTAVTARRLGLDNGQRRFDIHFYRGPALNDLSAPDLDEPAARELVANLRRALDPAPLDAVAPGIVPPNHVGVLTEMVGELHERFTRHQWRVWGAIGLGALLVTVLAIWVLLRAPEPLHAMMKLGR